LNEHDKAIIVSIEKVYTFRFFRRIYLKEKTFMTDEKEEKFWLWILAFAALIFAVYPMVKDFIENKENTILAMIFTLFFAGGFIFVGQLIYIKFIKHH